MKPHSVHHIKQRTPNHTAHCCREPQPAGHTPSEPTLKYLPLVCGPRPSHISQAGLLQLSFTFDVHFTERWQTNLEGNCASLIYACHEITPDHTVYVCRCVSMYVGFMHICGCVCICVYVCMCLNVCVLCVIVNVCV